MSSPVSSVNLSVLSLALSSWLDASAQLRRSLILFPLELAIAPSHDSNSSSGPALAQAQAQDVSDSPGGETDPIRLVDRCLQWFTKPARDLDEVEKVIVGALDLSSSVLLLKLLGSGPILPFILNPLSITLALPRKLSPGPVRWSQVVLLCFLLSTLHEAQRTSVVTGVAWLRMKKAAKNEANVGEVVLRGEKLEETNEDEDDEPCVICSGGQSEGTTLSDSISSITSLSTTHTTNSNSNTNSIIPDPGPLEAFCVHAPTKHPMHRSCFLAWKDAYWEARASRPIITLVSDDSAVPLPGTWQWRRAQAILASLGARIWNMTYYVPLAPAELTESSGVNGVGESVFTLRCTDSTRTAGSSEELGSMVSAWPPCPGCRSAVKMTFARARSSRHPNSSSNGGRSMISKLLCVWIKSWKQLVTSRTIIVKTATQVLFAAFLVSVMRMRKSNTRHLLISRRV